MKSFCAAFLAAGACVCASGVLAGCGSGRETFAMPTGREESAVFVEPVEGIGDGFVRGMDASSALAEERSGVKFYGFDGAEQDVFRTFAQAGVNCIRLRVWNDPFDKDGNGYGGGNNDLAAAVEMGKRATKYGMSVCIDFHYSDFWADPKRQHAPKAWEGMDIDSKSAALAEFTKKSLDALLDEGVDVSMVQIGNEINPGMAGETKIINVMKLLRAGSGAVREVSKRRGKPVKIAVHYTKISDEAGIDRAAATLANMKVDYDVFALSFYPFWDGTFENMKRVVRNLRENHGKEVMIAETSYCYTSEDGDGFGNSVSGKGDGVAGYPATVQGQASLVRDVFAAAHEAGATGVFYWEGAWIPVAQGATREQNEPVWEKFGSGWASSHAKEYDPEDAGLYYGGSSWDNQAMFDFGGRPLASLNVFKLLKFGSTAPLAVDDVPDVFAECNVGSPLALPEKVPVIYNDRSRNREVPVEWSADDLAKIDTNAEGEHTVAGRTADGAPVAAHVAVKMLNFARNPSFEDADTSAWTISHEGEKSPADFERKADNAKTGEVSLHFWSGDKYSFTAEQTLTNLEPGTYRISAFAQGGDADATASMELFAASSGGEKAAPFAVSGWRAWQKPTLTIKVADGSLRFGVRASMNARSWGTIDDFEVNRLGD